MKSKKNYSYFLSSYYMSGTSIHDLIWHLLKYKGVSAVNPILQMRKGKESTEKLSHLFKAK